MDFEDSYLIGIGAAIVIGMAYTMYIIVSLRSMT